jgi:outer membrane protein assembly factor BamB
MAAAVRTAGASPATALDRLDPSVPGTTWLYQEVTNGTPTGTATIRVVSAAMPVLMPGVVVDAHFDNYLGQGQPYDETRYQASQGPHAVLLGTSHGGTFSQLTPPQPLLEIPVRPGQRYTWMGKRSAPAADVSVTTTVVGVETLTVARHVRTGCSHLHDDSVETSAGQPDFRTSVDRWFCPGLGEVRELTDVTSTALHLDEELLSVHGPGIDFGPAAPAAPAATPGSVTPSAGGHMPSIDTTRLAWSDTRLNVIQFPPAGRTGLVVVEEEGGRLAAFDPIAGKVNWSVSIAVPAAAGPVVANDAVLVPDAAKHLLALDPATGATRWSSAFADVVAPEPVVAGDVVVVATEDGGLHGRNLEDGRVLWDTSLAADAAGVAQVGSDVVVATSDGTLTAVAGATGDVRWTRHLTGKTTAGPVAGNGVVVAADDQGELSAFDTGTGQLRWTDYIRTNLSVPLAVAPGRVLVADGSRVRAFDLAGGHERWSYRAGTTVTTPAVVGDDVIVATRDTLTRLAAADGGRRSVQDLPRPAPQQRARSALTPVVIGGQLLVTVTLDPGVGWPRTTILAFPDRADPGPDGVRVTGEYRPTPAQPARAPALRGSDLLLVGSTGSVVDVTAGGAARTVLAAKSTSPLLVSAGDLVLARDGDSLVAVSPTGDRLWTFPLGAPSLGDVPAVGGRSVLVPVHGTGLAALSPDTGRLQWLFRSPGVGSTTPLILPGGDVVFAVGALTRLDGSTGTVRWQIPNFEAFGPLAQDGATIYAEGFLNGGAMVVAVDAATGGIRWRLPAPVKALVGPTVQGSDVAVVGGDGVLRVLDTATGQLRWSLALPTPAAGSPVVVDGRLVVAEDGRTEDTTQLDHRMTVYDLLTGRFLGAFEPGGSSFATASFTADGGRLLFPSVTASLGVYILGLASP